MQPTLLAAVLFAAAGLGTQPSSTMDASLEPEDLVGDEWIAELVGDEPLVPGTRVTMRFDAGGQVSGFGGCNRFHGSWRIEDGKLDFGPLASTMMACPEPILDQEQRFHEALERAESVEIENGKLVFREGAEGTEDGAVITRLARRTTARLNGTVSYRERIALPPQAIVKVSLLDTSQADAPATVVAETLSETGGRQVPIPFELEYSPQLVDERLTYTLEAVIEIDGEAIFRTATTHPVLTRGAATGEVAIQVERIVSGPR